MCTLYLIHLVDLIISGASLDICNQLNQTPWHIVLSSDGNSKNRVLKAMIDAVPTVYQKDLYLGKLIHYLADYSSKDLNTKTKQDFCNIILPYTNFVQIKTDLT